MPAGKWAQGRDPGLLGVACLTQQRLLRCADRRTRVFGRAKAAKLRVDGGLAWWPARSGTACLRSRTLFTIVYQFAKVFLHNSVAMQSRNKVRVRFARRSQQLEAEHRSGLNGYLVFGKKDEIDFERKNGSNFGLLDSVKGERPDMALMREALVEKFHGVTTHLAKLWSSNPRRGKVLITCEHVLGRNVGTARRIIFD